MSSLFVTLGVKDKGTVVLKKFARNAERATKSAAKGFRGIGTAAMRAGKTIGGFASGAIKAMTSLKALVVGVAAAFAMKQLAGSFIEAASTAEGYRVRLNALLGDVNEGNRLFKDMATFAGKVPFEYKDIMGSATQLAGIMKGGVDEIKEWMPLIGDLAAASGMGIQETTSQVVRMYSAGAASADMFREKGILAMLGFQAGVKYSAEETRKQLMDSWNKSDSQFKGLTEKLAGTWEGLTSMLKDKWQIFREYVMNSKVFAFLKDRLQLLLNIIDEHGGFKKLGEDVGEFLTDKLIVLNNAIWDVVDAWPAIIDGVDEFTQKVRTLATQLQPLMGPLKWLVKNASKLMLLQWKGVGAFAKGAASVVDKATQLMSGNGTEESTTPSYATGTGPRGLPQTGLYMGHKGEIVKSPAESKAERRGKSGNTYNITISPQIMTGDRASIARAWGEFMNYQKSMGH